MNNNIWEENIEPLINTEAITVIRHLQSIGILISDPRCINCHNFMSLRIRIKTIDKYAWTCYHSSCIKKYYTLSIRHKSIFAESKISLFRLYKLIVLWSGEISINQCCLLVGVKRRAVGEFFAKLRSRIRENILHNPIRLGGYGVTCQVDESLFSHKAKYHRGRFNSNPIWVFGIVDSSQTPAIGYMEVVPNRSQDTLIPIISRVCRPGTRIISDEWKGYLNINRVLGFQHDTVNHSVNFVNPINHAHTQNIESYWAKQKLRIKKMKGLKKDLIQEYLNEFMWRDKVKDESYQNLINILRI